MSAMTLLLACLLTATAAVHGSGGDSPAWTWRCESSRCVRRSSEDVTDGMQLNTCKLTCGELSAVWPRPTGPATFGDKTVSFLIDNIQFGFVAPDAVKPMLQNASEIFLENLRMLQSSPAGRQKPGCTRGGDCQKAVASQLVQVVVTVDADDTTLMVETNEFNQLLINHTAEGVIDVKIYAATFFGARHALETLSQLINYDSENACLQVSALLRRRERLSPGECPPRRKLTPSSARP